MAESDQDELKRIREMMERWPRTSGTIFGVAGILVSHPLMAWAFFIIAILTGIAACINISVSIFSRGTPWP